MKTIMSKIDSFIESKIILWLIALGGILVHGILCFGKTIWLDEALTGSYIRMGWGELLQFTTTDVHPPLYYLIVKAGISLFGDSIVVVKWFSFLPFVLLVLLTVTKVRKSYGSKTAFVFLFFLCTTPCIIERNAEMRMYQWAMFFVTAFAFFLFEAVKEQDEAPTTLRERSYSSPKSWLLCILFGLGAAYTHYYALIAVIILYALIFFANIKNRMIVIRILLNAGASIIGYLPWLMVFFGQAKSLKESGWWQKTDFGLSDAYEYFVWPFADKTGYGKPFFLLLFMGALGYLLWKKQSKDRVSALQCIITYVVLICSGILIILFYQPVFITRFIYPTVGVLLLGLAMVFSKWRVEIICVISAILLLFAAKTYNSQLHYQFNEESVPKLTAFMEGVEEEKTLIVCDMSESKCIVEYLFPDYRIKTADSIDADDVAGKQVYYFVSDKESMEENAPEALKSAEYECLEEIYFRYHGFEIYLVKDER